MSASAVVFVVGFVVGLAVMVVGLWLPRRRRVRRSSGSRLGDLLPSLSAGEEANLRLAGITPTLYGVQRVTGLAAGLAVGAVVGLLWQGVGIAAFALALLVGATGWVLPMLGMRDTASKARDDFDRVVRVWIALVAQQVRAGTDPSVAMLVAARAGRRPAWDVLYRSLLAAQQQRRAAWEGLADIVDRYGVHSLGPAISALGLAAQHGTRVADAVLAAADTLWRESVSRERERVARRAQVIVVPATLVALGLAALLVYPPFSALTGGGLVGRP